MPSERILIEVVTAANMAGLEQAQAGMLGFTPQVLMAGAALAGLVFVGESAVKNFEKQQQATKDLTQAYGTQHDTLAAHQAQINKFLEDNKRFIADQYDTQLALANLVRTGLFPAKDAFRVLGDALDLSVIKHEAVSAAAETIIQSEAGSAKALRDLGITTEDYHKIMGDKTLPDAEKHRRLLELIETKTKDGRLATTDLQGTQNTLNKDWEDFSTRIAPVVITALDDILKGADFLVTSLGNVVTTVENILSLTSQGEVTGHGRGAGARLIGHPTMQGRTQAHAEGGFAEYTGWHHLEEGELVLNKRQQAGGGDTHLNIHIDRGAFIDGPSVDRLANVIMARIRYAPGS